MNIVASNCFDRKRKCCGNLEQYCGAGLAENKKDWVLDSGLVSGNCALYLQELTEQTNMLESHALFLCNLLHRYTKQDIQWYEKVATSVQRAPQHVENLGDESDKTTCLINLQPALGSPLLIHLRSKPGLLSWRMQTLDKVWVFNLLKLLWGGCAISPPAGTSQVPWLTWKSVDRRVGRGTWLS